MASVPTVTPNVDVADFDEDLFLDPEEGQRQFNALVESRLGITGSEFIRRFDDGEYQQIPDDDEHRDIIDLAMLIPFGR